MTHARDGLSSQGNGASEYRQTKRALTIIRVSREDQLRGYGPDAQWQDDILSNAGPLGLGVEETYRRIIQEPATGWDRPKFEAAVHEAIRLHAAGLVDALLFPRVDRETRFLYPSFPILVDALRGGLQVFFARERLQLDPADDESTSRYLRKAEESRAYVAAMRTNTMQGRRRRMERDHMMPTARSRWAYAYHPYRREWGKPRDAESGRFSLILDRGPIVRAWVRWILREGAALSVCVRRTKAEYGMVVSRSAISGTLRDPIVVGRVFAYRTRSATSPSGTRNVSLPENEWALVYEDPALRLVTDGEFAALKAKFKRNQANSPRNVKYAYPPLRGLVLCGSCGRKMSGQRRGTNQLGFRCTHGCMVQTTGKQRWVKAGPLWDLLQTRVRDIILQPNLVLAALKAVATEGAGAIGQVEAELKDIESKLAALDRAYEKALRMELITPSFNGMEGYRAKKFQEVESDILNQRNAALARQASLRERLNSMRSAQVDEQGVRRFLSAASHNLNAWDEAQWGVLLDALRVRITAYDDRINVELAVPPSEPNGDVIMFPTSPSCGRPPGPACRSRPGAGRRPPARDCTWTVSCDAPPLLGGPIIPQKSHSVWPRIQGGDQELAACFGGELVGGQVAQGAVRADAIVVLAPGGDDAPHRTQGSEPVLIQTFIP